MATSRPTGRCGRAGHALQLLVGHLERVSGVVAPPSGSGEDYARFLTPALRTDRHAQRGPSSMRPGTCVASSYLRPPRATGPASGCCTCAAAPGTGAGCSPRVGSTTGAPCLDRPRGRSPRGALVGGGRRHPRHLPRLGLRGTVDHHLPAARSGGGAPGQDAARARAEPGALAGAAVVEAFARAR